MQGGLHVLLENLINSTYQYHRERLSKAGIYGKIHSLATSYITFGGWEPSCDGAGWTRLGITKVGNISLVSKTLYLSSNYTYCFAGLPVILSYKFPSLLNTIAHELSHCLLGDFDLKWSQLHDEGKHELLTQEILKYLWTLPEVQELEKLVGLAEKAKK
ncbi:protein of unknown function [endosymbiont DhMRE of Dentiscutata heterogama]|uniref:hypothetical protein n=1 Tax=endosymbiont DhMRE of Dentiscutata heterogama TaxID=1609546 RepID=UPI000629D82B|nr:hypothetical protein [endosymbiont DhMRE of Dentiscutata heterogama]CFW93395.1 protein of unknown function [endosymbiont DhMRE of Dentiscutata heterogama]